MSEIIEGIPVKKKDYPGQANKAGFTNHRPVRISLFMMTLSHYLSWTHHR